MEKSVKRIIRYKFVRIKSTILDYSNRITNTCTRIFIQIIHETYNKAYRFEIRIDNNYPFTKPEVHSLDNIWRYGEAKNLL